MSADRWSAEELVEAFHIAYAAEYVVASELVDEQEREVGVLAAKAVVDAPVLAGLLDLLARRTDLVVRGARGFRRGPGLGIVEQAVIDQYVGAYGPVAAALPTILASPYLGSTLVDRSRHATAFARAPGPGATLLPRLLRELELDSVLDLGCGTGELLAVMAGGPPFQGVGVDANPDMIRRAQQRLRAGGVDEEHVRLYVGNICDLSSVVPDDVLKTVKAVVAASVLNEFCQPDAEPLVHLLSQIREALPGRVLVVADYYGALGYPVDRNPLHLLHDWIQLISSQGIPPPDLAAWEVIYRRASCTIVNSIENAERGTFIHLVRLGS